MQPYPLRFLKNLNRGREVATVLLNYGFGDVLERLGLLPYLKWGRRLITRKTREATEQLTTPRRIRLALEDLGPTFVKFGQVLSTRADLLPPDVIQELCKLQEHVPAFPVQDVLEQLEEEYHRPIKELFAKFDEQPLAAGSLAQVHTAVAKDGRELAVKVRRPDVVHVVERDVALMLELAQLLERHVPESRVFDPVGLVNQFTRTIRRELNFRREGRAMQEFARLFQDDPRLYVPLVESEKLCESVLVMERVDGLKVSDRETILKYRLDPALIARNGAEIFLRMAFEMGVFHGDPHPGNIRIRPDGSICLFDYGMIGFLDETRRESLIDLFVAVARNDVDTAVHVVMSLGQPTQRVEKVLLQADVRDFMDAYYGVPLEQLRIGPLLNDFIGILASHGLQCPGDLMVLVRAIVTLEGVGRQLDPHFNLAEVLAPFVERLIRERYHPRKVVERAFSDIRTLLGAAHDLPLHLGRTLQKISQDEMKVQLEHRGLDHLINEFDRSSNRIVVGLLISSLVLSTALIIRTASPNSMWIAVPIFILSGLLGAWLIWGILRSGRL
ncbi:ABC1 kinase family protein [Planctomicrobium sp. SH661]|uniref:ABC1 kinase family protein n=1 Tax=Planctomicrobium sp. SH661 TaxID=3448124 RepID=UPI003F5CBA54